MNELKNAMAEVRQNLIDFEQKLVRTSSLTGHEEDAARLVLAEMQKLTCSIRTTIMRGSIRL